MTLEKLKRESYRNNFYKMTRRASHKAIKAERAAEKRGIKKRYITKKTRFVCNHCSYPLKYSEWLWEMGGIIRCPKCFEEIMDISFTTRIEI